FRVTTHSRHPFPVAPNVLARQFERAEPDQAWVTDITYIPTGEGWLYLAVILDLCSRFAVGWPMSERITDDLTLDALGMALARRRPPRGLLHHSDRGSQLKFNRSSQHRTERGCDDDTKKAFGTGRTSETTLARPPHGPAAWSTERRRPSGMRIAPRADPSRRSSRPIPSCNGTCRSGWPARSSRQAALRSRGL